MIDVDHIERQLESAVPRPDSGRAAPTPAQTAPPRPRSAGAPGAPAGASRRDTVSWATMRALLAGDRHAARANSEVMLALAQEAGDQRTWDCYWMQRFWLAMEWGDEAERDELADHCRQRAYRADDLQWWAALSLLLAQTGKAHEAAEAFDDAFGRLSAADDAVRLDVATNLADTAFLLRDDYLGGRLHYTLTWTPGLVVTVGDGWVCKGAIERYRALGAAAVGSFAQADADFAYAVSTHRAMGAEPLLARTLHQWGTSLVGRDDSRAAAFLGESAELARRLHLSGPTGTTKSPPAGIRLRLRGGGGAAGGR